MTQPVVFLDRDGVINHDSDAYIKGWAEFRFIPGSLEALQRLTAAGFALVVITNQSAVGRGLITTTLLEDIHTRMGDAVQRHGGRLLDILFCPHLPEDGCRCRKPRPGLIEAACRRHGLNPAAAVMVGDSAKDILCGRRAGCRAAVLVRTGRWASAVDELEGQNESPDAVVDDLAAAADWIIRRFGPRRVP
jgi:D-glycero-D-manno-heptose 1,7-bisphosphate phosphatase